MILMGDDDGHYDVGYYHYYHCSHQLPWNVFVNCDDAERMMMMMDGPEEFLQNFFEKSDDDERRQAFPEVAAEEGVVPLDITVDSPWVPIDVTLLVQQQQQRQHWHSDHKYQCFD